MDLGKASDWDRFARQVNALWNIRGVGSSVQVRMTESGGTIEMPGAGSGDGLTDLDPEVSELLHVGTGKLWGGLQRYSGQPVRNWNSGGNQYMDVVGSYGEFGANSRNDFVWRLRLRMGFPFKLTRMEMYQVATSASGAPVWTTGQAWATNNPIKPLLYQPGSNDDVDGPNGDFQVFPMKVYSNGSALGNGALMNSEYLTELDPNTTYPAYSDLVFYLYGDSLQPVPVSEFFRLMIFATHATTGVAYRVVRGTVTSVPVDVQTEKGPG